VKNGKCLDVDHSRDEEGRNVLAWGKHNGANQRWNVLYTTDVEAEAKEGFDKEYGLYINRPFYIKSRMPMGRVMESIGASNVT